MAIAFGLPGNTFRKSAQKTVNGKKYKVVAKSYQGTLAGWNIYKNGQIVKFHNGKGLDNIFNPHEMLEWAILNT